MRVNIKTSISEGLPDQSYWNPGPNQQFGVRSAAALIFATTLRLSIMGRTSSQKNRLAYEKQILEKCFGSKVSWINHSGDTRVEVSVTCSNDKKYILRLNVPYLRISQTTVPKWIDPTDKARVEVKVVCSYLQETD